ncbi:MAG: hypothetical protein ACRDU8_02965, partial [Egibacteraceae bacterium]
GSALVAAPATYILRPGSAHAAVCGPGSECGSGWTVFCCTINRGVNKCPPGTFVGGWWKADNSPYCCDSRGNRKARYIIDCQGRCTKCKTGCADGFCSSKCVNCSCQRCVDRGTCDNRRHCCNTFRYGQCHQEIGCSGPVACRMVTCTPPYKLYRSCKSTVLKDNRTRAHNAPCLGRQCA